MLSVLALACEGVGSAHSIGLCVLKMSSSSCRRLVFVYEPAQDIMTHDSGIGMANVPERGSRRPSLAQRSVRTIRVVVRQVFVEHAFE
jgi:hypothetical protein